MHSGKNIGCKAGWITAHILSSLRIKGGSTDGRDQSGAGYPGIPDPPVNAIRHQSVA
jgi:hypothetical protein